jgi:hypothetical protein
MMIMLITITDSGVKLRTSQTRHDPGKEAQTYHYWAESSYPRLVPVLQPAYRLTASNRLHYLGTYKMAEGGRTVGRHRDDACKKPKQAIKINYETAMWNFLHVSASRVQLTLHVNLFQYFISWFSLALSPFPHCRIHVVSIHPAHIPGSRCGW